MARLARLHEYFARVPAIRNSKLYQSWLVGREFLTSVSMVNLFRYIFGSMPQYGEGFGNLLGVVVGLYLNNIFVFVVSGYVFKPILKSINPEWTMAKTFKPEFPKEIIGECLRFGIQSMSATFVDTGFKMVITYMAILWLPSYGTLFGLFTASMNLVTLCAIDIPITPIVSEAYNNKKKDLTEYYMGHGLKYCGMFASIFGSTILAIAPIFIYMAGPYAEIAPYLPYIVLTRMIFGFGKMLDDCTNGCDKPFFRVFYYLIENSARLGFMALFILGLNLGWVGYLLAEGCGMFLKVIIGWAIFRYRIMNPYMSVMQTLILPAISGLVHFLVIKGLILILFNPMSALIGPHVSIGIFSGICLIITPLFVWWPTYTLLGGWDPVGLDIMEEATEIAGISKVIARQFNKMTKKLARKSPWYNRWRIHFRSAQYELDEIRVMMGREPKRSLHVFDFMPKLPILQHSDINFQAYDISKRGMTYDQLIWMLAEESLRIQEAITISSTSKNKPPKFRIKPDFLNHQPSHEKIEKRAKMIAEQQRPPTNELHWYIAERMLLYKYISENSDKELMEFALK